MPLPSSLAVSYWSRPCFRGTAVNCQQCGTVFAALFWGTYCTLKLSSEYTAWICKLNNSFC